MKYLKLYLDDKSYMADKPNLGKLWVASTQSEKHVYYSSEINNSLCFTALEDNASIKMTLNDSGKTPAGWQDKNFYYKKNDDVEWTAWVFENNTTTPITLNKGDKLYVRSDSDYSCGDFDSQKFYHFTIEGKISASGNIMSLLNFSPVLPNYAFLGLFIGCTSLVSAPALPATTLTDGCYFGLFSGCSSLTKAPELPATTLANSCYYGMFYGCSSLTQAPELPVTTLVEDCYDSMFSGCTSLTQAPALPATTLARTCYASMFYGCSSLTQAPELPATTLADHCYYFMFNGCSQLNYIKALFTTTPGLDYTSYWLDDVSPVGTFVKSKDATWTNEQADIPIGWTVQVEKDYLCFTSTGNSTVAMTQRGTPSTSANKVIQYKLNDGKWQTWDLSAVSLADGDKMYLKSDDNIPISESNNIYKQFKMSGSIAASGNIMSLLNFSTTLTDYAFSTLLNSCSSLTQAPELPATTLANSCYYGMFGGCSSLTQAPELPATTLAEGCYKSMFYGCESLTQAPALPATTLASNCYSDMFTRCSSLVQAPELPATTLASYCYGYMFDGCYKLNYIKALFTTTPSDTYTDHWVSGVSKTGTFVKSKDANWNVTGVSGIPSGWTVTTV